jgi:hypothetical protein
MRSRLSASCWRSETSGSRCGRAYTSPIQSRRRSRPMTHARRGVGAPVWSPTVRNRRAFLTSARPRADGPHALASTSSRAGRRSPCCQNPTRSPLRTAVSVVAAPSSTRLTSARAVPTPVARPAGRTLLPSIRSRAAPGFEPAAARLRGCRRGQRGTLDAPRSICAGSAPAAWPRSSSRCSVSKRTSPGRAPSTTPPN